MWESIGKSSFYWTVWYALTQMIILSACSTLGWDRWPITLPHPAGLGDYTHTPLIGICWTISPSASGFHQTCWAGSNFSQLTMYWYNILLHWVGIKLMTWDSQSQTWTTWAGVNYVVCINIIACFFLFLDANAAREKRRYAITGLLKMRIPLQCFRKISGCNYKLASAPEASPMGNKV